MLVLKNSISLHPTRNFHWGSSFNKKSAESCYWPARLSKNPHSPRPPHQHRRGNSNPSSLPAFTSLATLSRSCSSKYATSAWSSAFLASSADTVRRISDLSDRFDAGVLPTQLGQSTNAADPNMAKVTLNPMRTDVHYLADWLHIETHSPT
ncbi:uncharacterized protein CC84DRAFT_787319 [Paraphaeosphaeria sporulosa]|uniref:Uncharacterized protein n=1 Tax=Paraphaeosphaeria sporulosa TaxID=1460663 RepID=A0A177C9R2_9PLEO|nr:uncharacterized protein CC84DRAFT_787319 [Paraphaeosphaeria sporulosa]OAG04315.1 hypothetical protein CC84DRAFT_787319 [Paraphaeosphaeria sporulosa]